MRLVFAALFAVGLLPLLLAWRHRRATSLSHALVWAMVAWLGWGLAFLMGNADRAALDPGELRTRVVAQVVQACVEAPDVVAFAFEFGRHHEQTTP